MSSFDDFIGGLTPEQIQKLKEALNSAENKTIEIIYEKPEKENSKSNSVEVFTTIKASGRGKEPVKAKKNTWTDNGEFRDDENLKMPKFDPSPRSREKAKKVEVECHVCGKTFFEDPRYIYGEFMRCSRCGRK